MKQLIQIKNFKNNEFYFNDEVECESKGAGIIIALNSLRAKMKDEGNLPIENVVFEDTTFKKCTFFKLCFNSITFLNCKFENVQFLDCTGSRLGFNQSRLLICKFKNSGFKHIGFSYTTVNKSTFYNITTDYLKLNSSLCLNSIFESCSVMACLFNYSDLYGTQISKSDFIFSSVYNSINQPILLNIHGHNICINTAGVMNVGCGSGNLDYWESQTFENTKLTWSKDQFKMWLKYKPMLLALLKQQIADRNLDNMDNLK